ncbi:unnamed protein product, partial [Urochloa humidicola]
QTHYWAVVSICVWAGEGKVFVEMSRSNREHGFTRLHVHAESARAPSNVRAECLILAGVCALSTFSGGSRLRPTVFVVGSQWLTAFICVRAVKPKVFVEM